MSQIRHGAREADLVVRSLALDLAAGTVLEPHAHAWHQLVFARAGVLEVTTEAGSWVVPPQRAVWVPADARHAVRASGKLELRTLYLRPSAVPWAEARGIAVLSVTPLLRELVLAIVAGGVLDATVPRDARRLAVLVDELDAVDVEPLSLVMPVDPRARRVADVLRDRPSDPSTLADFAEFAGTSSRTLERLFRRETGLTFAAWRTQARLLAAVTLLADGRSVTDVALDVGYASPSAFVHAFRRHLALTPGRYHG